MFLGGGAKKQVSCQNKNGVEQNILQELINDGRWAYNYHFRRLLGKEERGNKKKMEGPFRKLIKI